MPMFSSNLFKIKHLLILTAGLYILCAVLAFVLPPLHDYSVYIKMWKGFLQTGHPYVVNGEFNKNAYGPLFIFLAYPYTAHIFFPRFIFVSIWFLLGITTIRLASDEKMKKIVWAVFFLSPLFYILFLLFGINEIVITLCLVISLLFLIGKGSKKNEIAAGIFLALGILFKFTLLVLVPFIVLKKDGLRWKFLISCVTTIAIGFGLGYLAWGKEILTPLAFAVERQTTLLSIFYPFRHILPDSLISFLSNGLLAGGLFALFLAHFKHRYNVVLISILALLTVFMLYKISLPHYHVSVIILSLIWMIQTIKSKPKISFAPMYIYITWISTLMVFYITLNNFYGDWEWIRMIISIPTFIVSFAMTIFLLRNRTL